MDGFKWQVHELVQQKEGDIMDRANKRIDEIQGFLESTLDELNKKRVEV